MQTKIDIRELSDRFTEVISLALAGNEVILMEGNLPRARLVPLNPGRPRIAGLHAGAIRTASDFDEVLSDDFWTGSADSRP